jgi:two-component system chemotaxis response regulator CheB
MRVLVVDDSVVVRRLVTDVLQESGIEIAAALSTGDAALEWVLAPNNSCDAIVMDVEMPGLTGLQCVAAMRSNGVTTPVAMFSTVTGTDREQAAAREAGANASVKKPANVGSVLDTKRALAEELVPTLERLVKTRPSSITPRAPRFTTSSGPAPAETPGSTMSGTTSRTRPSASGAATTPPPVQTARPGQLKRVVRPQIVVIGSSTGGPDALARVFKDLRADINVPIIVAQHMPESFTKLLAERLSRVANRPVELAENGMPLQANKVLVAPGGSHLSLIREGAITRCRLSKTPDVGIYPSADVLFSSAVAVFGPAVLGVVLTGMGADGLQGGNDIHRAGGSMIAQDAASCVVWGMPRAITEAGIADVVQLDEIASAVNSRVKDRA